MNYHITLQRIVYTGEGSIEEPSRVASFVREFDRDTCIEALREVYPINGYVFESVDTAEDTKEKL